ncbi:MAG TPA: hypothetical protein VFB36_00520 [Nevskiaceae bacterium]|nr:hypothetical protein [Nevskiaceae bacterium]
MLLTSMFAVVAAGEDDWLHAQVAYADNNPVRAALTNTSKVPLRVRVDIEQLQPDSTWAALPTYNKAIWVLELQPGESRDIQWHYWKDEFTLEKRVSSGTYRFRFVNFAVGDRAAYPTTLGPVFGIKRQ